MTLGLKGKVRAGRKIESRKIARERERERERKKERKEKEKEKWRGE